jgi:hypothetical protein
MTEPTADNFAWSVTLIYEGGPRDGQREGRNMREDPEQLTIVQFVDRVGGEQVYTIADRQIDRTAGTAVLTLRYGPV